MNRAPDLNLRQEADRLIKEGDLATARELMSQIEIKKIDREELALFAALARRLELFHLALRMLNPIIRGADALARSPRQSELLEYGIVLMKVGALEEARKILGSVDAKLFPDALLFLGMSYFSEWDYGAALPHLRAYLGRGDLSAYKRAVGEVNLLAALICEKQFEEAEGLVNDLLKKTAELDAKLLHSNCLELRAQLEFERGNLESARRGLNEALQTLSGTNSISELYIRKWAAICQSYVAGQASPSLLEVRARALERLNWEVVRDCDLHKAVVEKDVDLLLKCYFGSPFPHYRKRVLRYAPVDLELPEHYLLRSDGDSFADPPVVIDLEAGEIEDEGRPRRGKGSLSVGSNLHGYLLLLGRDFYQPLNIVTAFSRLAPDEYYDPNSSPSRIHQLANRLRAWLEENQLPLRLDAIDGGYRLIPKGPVGLRVPRDFPALCAQELQFLKLRRVLKAVEFKAKDVREALDISFGSANALLKWSVGNTKVERLGTGAGTKYRFK